MKLLSVEKLGFTFAGAEEKTLRNLSFCLRAGEFALLTGETGCGKSTLLRLIKRELAPRGEREGRILFDGVETDRLSPREAAGRIGFVFQRPEEQIVTDRVWHELAFGPESLGMPERMMRRKIAETAQFFGLEKCFDRRPDQLSGGQRQLLNLAAVCVMEPDLLLLDEPTARLDPISAKQFLSALERLNREMGVTVLMAEHHLEDSLGRADRLLVMEAGSLVEDGTPREVCGRLKPGPAEGALPAAARLWRICGREGTCPLSAGEGRNWIRSLLEEDGAGTSGGWKKTDEKPARAEETEAGEEALCLREVRMRFSRDAEEVLRSVNLRVRKGEIFALLGGNGSGKTTLLRAAAGLIPPVGGEIRLFGQNIRKMSEEKLRRGGVALLPQDPQVLFLRMTALEELRDVGLGPEDIRKMPFDLTHLLERHPYDLSGGEAQLLGLVKVLAARPRLLLLDEPTGGLDARWRGEMRRVMKELQAQGVTILMATHDAEFAAECADRCGLLFRGRVEAAEETRAFFAGGSYYTPPVSRMAPGCRTVEEAAERLRVERERRPRA